MRKAALIALAAAAALVSCTKHESRVPAAEISFQTAAYSTKAGIDGPEFPKDQTFGVYAWAEGTINGGYFMDNERIGYGDDGLWKAEHTYYWPTDVTIDFWGYYPYGMSGLTVGADAISYSDIDVEASQTDILYSSKAVGYGYNPDGKGRGLDGSTGVPILFHHALGKVVVDARTAYDHAEEADGSVYDWEVTVNNVTLSDYFYRGGATFTLAEEPSEGVVPFIKPTDEDGNDVWTSDGAKTFATNNPEVRLNSEQAVTILPEFFVLPQTIIEPEKDEDGFVIPGQKIQRISLDLTVTTTLNGEHLFDQHFTRSAYLWLEDLPAWEINYRTRYLIIIYPLGYQPSGDMPVITFDPAVADWDYKTVSTTIVL